ncbi:MAG TPA: deaminase [Candidatus Methanomethylophilaceae archaeon]|nr:deaminase [Candidatus Methanomethylophilaceae archaeon]
MHMHYFSGTVITEDGAIEGYVCLEDGIVAEVSEGKCPKEPTARGIIIPPMINGHTHCADGGLKVPKDVSLNDLVGPDGLKHQFLRKTPNDILAKEIKGYSELSQKNGIETFIDFREGGVAGSRLLREIVPSSLILGRPVSKEYDSNEIDDILRYADGIGISGIDDIDTAYVEAVSDQTHRNGKIFAIHASEGVRDDIDSIMALSPSFLVHMASSQPSDLLRCVDEDVPIVVCPRSNRFFGLSPPLALMEEYGNITILGTDNAMICSPDLRAEAKEYISLLKSQGGTGEGIWNTMVFNGRKLLSDDKAISICPGIKADIVVLPSKDGDANSMVESRERILRFNMTEKEM